MDTAPFQGRLLPYLYHVSLSPLPLILLIMDGAITRGLFLSNKDNLDLSQKRQLSLKAKTLHRLDMYDLMCHTKGI